MRLKTLLPVATGAALSAFQVGSAFADPGDGPGQGFPYYHGPGMMWGGDQWGGFGMIFGPIFMILVLVGIFAGVVYLLRMSGWQHPASAPGSDGDRALAILKERFAKGEIDAQDFEDRKRLLKD